MEQPNESIYFHFHSEWISSAQLYFQHRQVVFLQRRWGYHVLLVSLILRTVRYQRIHLMEQPNESIYFHFHSEWISSAQLYFHWWRREMTAILILRLYKRVPPVNDPTAMPYLWDLIRAKQQSMAATAWVIWLCACVRYWPDRGMVNVCLLFYVCKIEAAVSFISTY